LTELDSLQEVLGVSFEDIFLLQQALVHRSYLNEANGFSLPLNERLEFLGDAFLGLVVTERLFKDFPDLQEGELTKLRSALVRTDTLARVAVSLDLGNHLLMGKGEKETGGRQKRRNLACTFEAVVGAVLVDQGLEKARDFVLRALASEFGSTIEEKLEKDPKSKLQEGLQASQRPAPTYRLVESTGPDHEKVFTVEVLAEGIVLAQGTGKSKQKAEQVAAREALKKLEKGEGLV